jgi:non-specific serine/threonine protein kinase/serine/threonine-protein kinase
MSNVGDNRSREIFESAVKLESSSRMPFIHSACEGDIDLLYEVYSLLDSHNSTLEPAESVRQKKSRSTALLAGIVMIVLIAGVAVSLWQAISARRERDRAEYRLAAAQKLSDSFLFEITPKIEVLPGSTDARVTIVTRTLAYLDTVGGSADDPHLRSDFAATYEKVGDLQGNPNLQNLADFDGAIASYDKARAIRERIEQTPDNRLHLARDLQISGLIRDHRSDVAGSIRDMQTALSLFGELRVADPASADLALAAVAARVDYARICSQNGQYEESISAFREAANELSTLDQNAPETQKLQTKAHYLLSDALSAGGQLSDAKTEIEAAVALAESLSYRLPDDSEVKTLVSQAFQVASRVLEQSDPQRSLDYSQRSLTYAEKALATDKADVRAKYGLATARFHAGSMYVRLNDAANAQRLLSQAESALNELVAAEPKNTIYQSQLGRTYSQMGKTAEKRGDISDALLKYQNAAVIFEKVFTADPNKAQSIRDLAGSLKNVGFTAAKLGQAQTFRQSLERALRIINDLKSLNAATEADDTMTAEIEAALAGR